MEALMELFQTLSILALAMFVMSLIPVLVLNRTASEPFVAIICLFMLGSFFLGIYSASRYRGLSKLFFQDQVNNHGCIVKVEKDAVKCKSPYGITYTRFEN